jgi:hypothetical protein
MVPQNSMNRLREMPRRLHVSRTDSSMAIRPSCLRSGPGVLQTDRNFGEKRLYVIAITGGGFLFYSPASDIKHQRAAVRA